MAEVTIKNLNKRYNNGAPALQDVNLQIASGEFVVLVGPSGCGKSSLLRTIAGLEKPTSGEIFIDRRPVLDLTPFERDIAMVFQDYALYPHMTVRANLEFGMRARKTPAKLRATQLEFATEALKLGSLLERKPFELSGGQRQRVAIGRAIIRNPKVFLFDEPLSNLDSQLRMQMRIEISALHRKLGTTTVYVTHDQIEALTLADRIAILNRGRVQQIGPPLELYHRPANRFVAGFLGNPGMNFISGRIDAEGNFASAAINLKAESLEFPPQVYNQPVILGVRPEALTALSSQSLGQADARFPISAVQTLGHETLIALDYGAEDPLMLRLSAADWDRLRFDGQTNIAIRIERSRISWFAADETAHRLFGGMPAQ